MKQRQLIPGIVGYAGFQALLPGLGKCPIDVQVQPPWFTGVGGAGFCPPEYWNASTVGVGVVLLALAVAVDSYTKKNRLLIDDRGLGVVTVEDTGGGMEDSFAVVDDEKKDDMIPFRDITDWKVTPVGLVVETSSSGKKFFPVAWDSKSVEAVLGERL